jgi:hypothetical protein
MADKEKPFFSPGHVFYTTAGYKAVDPDAARKENSWLEVSQLRVGNILYRLSADGLGYDHVEVKSIEVEHTSPETTYFYGLHLREGARSYHANGYLVRMNYPEVGPPRISPTHFVGRHLLTEPPPIQITVKSIARHLALFSPQERTRMLYHIKELRPIFERFGAATMSEVLAKEIKGAKRRPMAVPPIKGRKTACHLRKATRTYSLKETEPSDMEGYSLPVLAVHDGTVILDGLAQHRAVIEKDDRTIRWTRPVPAIRVRTRICQHVQPWPCRPRRGRTV